MTTQTTRQRLALGLASSALTQALAAAQAIVLVPFFVSAWEPHAYGRWLALSAIASHLTLADLGGQNYVANLLAMHFGRDEAVEFRTRLSEAVSLFLMIGFALLALLVLGLVWAAWLPLGLSGPALTGNEALALLLLGANAVILSVPGGVYGTAYRASGRFARGAAIGNVGRIVTMAGSMALLAGHATPAALAAWMLASAAAVTGVLVVDSRRVIAGCREVRIGVGPARAGFRRLARGSLHFWSIGLAGEMTQQGVLVILAATTSPVAVALYSTHRVLASIPARLATLAQGPVAPELSFLWAQRRQHDLIAVSLFAATALMAIGAVAAGALWTAAPLFYGAWTSNSLSFDGTLACILIVQSILASGWQTSAWSLLATNQHHALSSWSAARAALTVIIALALAGPFGAVGVAAGALAADIVCAALVFPGTAAAMLGAPRWQFHRRIALGLVPLVPVALSAAGMPGARLESDHAGRAAAGLFTAALAVAVAWPLVMPTVRSFPVRWRA